MLKDIISYIPSQRHASAFCLAAALSCLLCDSLPSLKMRYEWYHLINFELEIQFMCQFGKNHSTGNLTWPKSIEKARHQRDSHLRLATMAFSGSLRMISSAPKKAGRGRMLGSLYWIVGKFALGGGGNGRTTRSLGLSKSLGLLPLSPAGC